MDVDQVRKMSGDHVKRKRHLGISLTSFLKYHFLRTLTFVSELKFTFFRRSDKKKQQSQTLIKKSLNSEKKKCFSLNVNSSSNEFLRIYSDFLFSFSSEV